MTVFVTRATEVIGDQRVINGVIPGVKDECVIRSTAVVRVNHAAMVVVVNIVVLQTVFMKRALLLMDLAIVMKDISVTDVKTTAAVSVEPVPMALSVQCALMVNTGLYVLWCATVMAARVIY